jgi:hypothetical protein
MAPRSKASPNPAEQVDEIQKQRMGLAVEKATAQSELERSYDALGIGEPLGPNTAGRPTVRPLPAGELSIVERRQIAEEAQALGRDHEPFEVIAKDEGELGAKIRANGPRTVALEGAMRTLAEEIEAVEAEHRGFFVRLAEEGAGAAEAQIDALLKALDATTQVLQDTWGRWNRVSIGVSTRDLAHVRRELEETRRTCCWPQRSEAAYRSREATTTLSVPEVREQLLEMI